MWGVILAGVPAFVLGLFVGACLGVLLMAALFVSGRLDRAAGGE